MRPALLRPIAAHPMARRRVPLGLGVALALAVSSNEASAAALGSLATSVGLFAVLAILFVIKGWPMHLPASALPTAGGVLVVAAGAAWLWRVRATQHVAGYFAPSPTHRAPSRDRRLPCPASPAALLVLPAGIERAALLSDLRLQFVRMQAAWDAGDVHALGALTTPQMLEELCRERPGCVGMTGCEAMRTDVVTLQAELLGFEDYADTYLVSVDFSGLIRESADHGAAPFRELWMLAKSKHDTGGWRLARHQALL